VYASPNIIRVINSMRWAGHAARTEEIRNENNILVQKSERKRSLEDLRKYQNASWRNRMVSVDWINLVWDRDQWRALVNTVMNLWAP
jgi:hypothetical protein